MLVSIGQKIKPNALLGVGFIRTFEKNGTQGFFSPYRQEIAVCRNGRLIAVIGNSSQQNKAFGYVNNCEFGFRTKIPKEIGTAKVRQVQKCYYSARITPKF